MRGGFTVHCLPGQEALGPGPRGGTGAGRGQRDHREAQTRGVAGVSAGEASAPDQLVGVTLGDLEAQGAGSSSWLSASWAWVCRAGGC